MRIEVDFVAKINKSFDTVKQKLDELPKRASISTKSMDSMKQHIDRLTTIRGNINLNTNTAISRIRTLNGEISKTQKELRKLENLPPKSSLERLTQLTEKYKGLLLVAGGAMLANGVKNGLQSSVKLAMDAEQAQTAYGVLLQDAGKAKALLADMDVFAAKTPFQKTELVEAGQSLLGFGVKSQNLLPIMGRLGDLAQGNGEKFKSLVDNYGKLVSAQRGNTMDLNQFAIAGVPIWKELEKILGKSGTELCKYVEQNGVSVGIINQAISNLTSNGGQFFGMMDKQSQTATGKWSNMLDAFDRLKTKIGNLFLGAFGGLTNMLMVLAEKLSGVLGFLEKHTEVFLALGIAITPLIVKYSVLTGMMLKNAIAARMATLAEKQLLVASKASKIASLGNPYTLAIVGALALGAAIWGIVKANRANRSTLVDEKEIRGQAMASVVQETVKVQRLMAVIKDSKSTRKEQIGALQQLKEIAPQYFEKLDLEKAKTIEATNAVSAYTAELYKNAMQKIANSMIENDPHLNKITEDIQRVIAGKEDAHTAGMSYGGSLYEFISKKAKYKKTNEGMVMTDGLGNERLFKGAKNYDDVQTAVYSDKELTKSIATQALQNKLAEEQQKLVKTLQDDGLMQKETEGYKNPPKAEAPPDQIVPTASGENIASGGKQQKNITIRMNNLIERFEVSATNITEGADNIKEKVQVAILQAINSANAMA